MFTSVDTLASDLQQYYAGSDHFAMYRIRNTEVGRAVLQVAAGKYPENLPLDDSDLEALKAAAVKFVRDVMLSPTSDDYALLGVSIDADAGAIREQFRRLMGLVHPDTRPTDFPGDSATRVNQAYAVLAEADSRAAYTDELFGAPAAPSGNKSRPVARGVDAGAEAGAAASSKFASIVRVVRSRGTLLWLALLLLAPLGIWIASLFSQEAPTRLVEARPKLQVATAIAPQTADNPPSAPTAAPSLSPVAPAAALAPAAAPEAQKLPARGEGKAGVPAPRGAEFAERVPAGIMSNQLSDRSLALTARVGGRAAGSTAPVLPGTPPAPMVMSDAQPRATATRDLAPTASAAAPLPASPPPAVAPPSVAMASPASARSEPAERSDAVNRVRAADADEILVRFTNAYESGSINGFAQLLSPAMSGRRQMLSDYERVFSTTRQRSIKFNQLKHTPNGDRVATSGYATVTTVDQDNRTTTQRVFLEFEIGRDRGEPRIERLANYVIH